MPGEREKVIELYFMPRSERKSGQELYLMEGFTTEKRAPLEKVDTLVLICTDRGAIAEKGVALRLWQQAQGLRDVLSRSLLRFHILL